MIKKIVILPLFVLVLISVNQQAFIHWMYEMNKDYVINTLCEDVYRVEKLCGGRCVLMKGYEIIGDYHGDTTEHTVSIDKANTLQFCSELFAKNLPITDASSEKLQPYWLSFYHYELVRLPIKPPIV